MKPSKEELEEAIENLEDDISHLSGWYVPPGHHAAVLAPNGHLSLVHTNSLVALRELLCRILNS